MALTLQFTPFSYTRSLCHLKLKHQLYNNKTIRINHFPISFSLQSSSTAATSTSSCNPSSSSIKLTSLTFLNPYLQSEWRPILSGWFCSGISVYSLSQIVPLVGKFSSLMTNANLMSLKNEGLILGVLVLARIVTNYLQHAFLWEAALNCVYKIRIDVFNRVLQRDLGFFEGEKGILPGDATYRITAEASDISDTIYSLLNTIVPSTLQLSAMATQMLIISRVLSLISALVIPSMALIIGCLGEKLRKVSNEAHLSAAALSAYLNEGVGKAYNELKQGEPAIERLFHLSLFKSQVVEKPDAVDLPSVTGEVQFCGLSFSYGDSMPLVVNGLDLHIRAGETVALVGPSGGGKTTLVKLLLRLYDPCSGSILIDGCDIQNLQFESLRRHVGLVSQDTVLFSGTIAENIGYRDLIVGINMDKVEIAARTANADEFIKSLPDQYQTNVGPRGSNFSGGQRQRLAIARALYQNPSILILDEATSALDCRSELLVREALQSLLKNRTVLVIAHRLETVLMAERIFLLNDGKLQQLSRSSLMDGQHGSLASTGLVV